MGNLDWYYSCRYHYSDNGIGQCYGLINAQRANGIHSEDIIDKLSYNTKNDKAFSVNGRITHPILKCNELSKPRITKKEIKIEAKIPKDIEDLL